MRKEGGSNNHLSRSVTERVGCHLPRGSKEKANHPQGRKKGASRCGKNGGGVDKIIGWRGHRLPLSRGGLKP